MKIKIAASADTILYLPIYCLEHVHRPPGLEIEVDTHPEPESPTPKGDNAGQLGDDGAYRKLQKGEADLCVCDPMVVLDEFKNHTSTIGVVVASLVTSTGLWGLRTPALAFRSDENRSFFDQIRSSPGVSLSKILTYDTASSASHVIRYIIEHKILPVTGGFDAQKRCKFGQELNYLNKPLEPGNEDSIPELIVTCDLVGAIAAETKAASIAPGHDDGIAIGVRFARERRFQSSLFTGLIAHRGFLRNNREVVIRIVAAIQEILTSFHASERLRWSMAEMMAGRDQFCPSLKQLGCTPMERLRFWQRAMDDLKKDAVLATSVRISKVHWQRQAEIWELAEVKSSFSSCTDTSIGSKADPRWILRHTRRLRRFLLPVLLPFALIVESFHGLAGLYHLYHWEPGVNFWRILLATVFGLFLLLWLFGLKDRESE